MRSIVWDNQDFPISQEFGVPGFRPDWYQYSAEYGWPAGYHIGLDVAMPRGTTIRAAEGGQVIQAGMSPHFRPEPVYVQEDDGDIAIYGHLWESRVREGDSVSAGQVLGRAVLAVRGIRSADDRARIGRAHKRRLDCGQHPLAIALHLQVGFRIAQIIEPGVVNLPEVAV
ncbi:MAG: M23 family metallopeptidase [Candidatus Bipolaricaulota bacterium]|nr:M23 family metallopeptidase [Candidatus Bipolaricaulota bacterium]